MKTLTLWLLACILTLLSVSPSTGLSIKSRHGSLSAHHATADDEMVQVVEEESMFMQVKMNANFTDDFSDITNNLYSEYSQLPDWARYCIGAGLLIFGMVLTVYGYKFIRATIFIVCGFICAAIMYGILQSTISDTVNNKGWITYGVSLAVWIITGILFLYFNKAAFFMLGASVGIIIAMVLNPVALIHIWPEQPVANLYIWMFVFGLITGLLVLCIERPILIISTSLSGAFLMIISIGTFAGHFPMIHDLTSTTTVGQVPWQWWAYFGGFLGILFISLFVQFKYTAVKEDHSDYKRMY